ncbi:hypothetical protein PsorP6_002447 [Peronosclerospora sorghi]|uniref:Uncharacterized protein n=1 Tax=Peronosclerospora sorghi TaxID=230839 RepID=A0ACC0WRR8_9STRA|nr:hypothetical protein PsorP6_002447 [Peronosclerospora sorghi]
METMRLKFKESFKLIDKDEQNMKQEYRRLELGGLPEMDALDRKLQADGALHAGTKLNREFKEAQVNIEELTRKGASVKLSVCDKKHMPNYGLPCSHIMRDLMIKHGNEARVSPASIHPHWFLDQTFNPMDCIPQQQLLPPMVMKPRQKKLITSEQKAAKRNGGAKRMNKCGGCDEYVRHNSKTCPIKYPHLATAPKSKRRKITPRKATTATATITPPAPAAGPLSSTAIKPTFSANIIPHFQWPQAEVKPFRDEAVTAKIFFLYHHFPRMDIHRYIRNY